MTGRRRDVHRHDDDEDRERQACFDRDESGESQHRRASDGRPVAAEPGQEHGAIERGEAQRQDQERELGEQQAPVGRAHEPGDVADVGDREPGSGRREHEHEPERGAREPPRRQDRVGPRVSACLAGGSAQEKRQREEAADPDAGAEHVQSVEDDRARGVRLHGGGMARRGQRHQRGDAEQHRLAPRRAPIGSALDRHSDREKRGEQGEEAGTHEPHVSGQGLDEHLSNRARVEGRCPSALEQRGLRADDHDS